MIDFAVLLNKRCASNLISGPANIRKFFRASTLLALAFLVLPSVVQAEGAPYFQGCSAAALNMPNGLQTQLTANLADPNGALPGSLVSVLVTGPGGFSYDLIGDCGGTVCSAVVPVSPGSGTYAFVVTDNEGKTATSTSYLQVGTTIPVLDTTTFTATGSLSNPTLSWSVPAAYAGMLFYMVTIRDDDGTLHIFQPTINTYFTVDSPGLDPTHTYQWWVTAMDQYNPILTGNASSTPPQPLVLSPDQPSFGYATVVCRHRSSGYQTQANVNVIDPNGTLPDSIASLTVTAPNGAPVAQIDDFTFDAPSNAFTLLLPGKPADGIYTFTVTDIDGKSATTYDHVHSQDIPLVETATMQASLDPLKPVLSWGLPATMTFPLYSFAIIYDASDIEVWRSSMSSNPSARVPTGKLQAGVSYKWRVRAFDGGYGFQFNRSDSDMLPLTLGNNDTPYFTWYGVYYRHDSGGYSITPEAQVRDPDGSIPTSIASLTVTGPNGFFYEFQQADYTSGDDEYWQMIPGFPTEGVYTFTIADVNGKMAVTHCYQKPAEEIPIIDPAGLAVNGDPLAPTVSWNAIAAYPGRLHYRLRVIDQQGNPVFSSPRSPMTAATVPGGLLTAGNSYSFRVEAQNDRDYPIYSSRSNSPYYPLTVPFVVPVPDLSGKWKKLKCQNFGQTAEGEMLVKNTGNANAGAFTIKCYTSKNGVKLGKLIKTIKVKGGLQAGQKMILPFKCKSKNSLIGSYIVAVLDASKVIPEQSETNNKISKKVK